MIKKLLTITITISALTLTAQDEIDALRYSTQDIIGTARHSSMGGAFGSLGGEFSGLSSNPAGIGMYQYSEITFTPYMNLNSNRSYYNSTYKDAYRSELSIGNLGIVFTMPQSNTNWKRINLGIGWNQLANYNNAIKIEGQNNSSIVDQIIDITNGNAISDIQNGRANYLSEMAWNTYLIDPLLDNSNMSASDFDDISNSANTLEFGFANFRTNQTVNYSLRLFNISTSNEITPYQLSDGLVLYRNAGKTIKRGAEIELGVKITDQLNFDYSASVGNYKFESFKFNENDFSNNIMPGIPQSNQSIKLSYTNENSYNLIIGLKRVGKMFADNANETEIDGYNSVSIKMSKNLKIFKTSMIPFVSIDNLLNEKYFDNIRINAFGSRFYEPASGINIVGGLKINL